MLGGKVVGLIDGHHKEEKIKAVINQVDYEIEEATKTFLETISLAIAKEVKSLEEKLQELEDSPGASQFCKNKYTKILNRRVGKA